MPKRLPVRRTCGLASRKLMRQAPRIVNLGVQEMNKRARILSDIAGLSSGTMSTIIRDKGLVYGYQCRDCWVIDQFQGRFSLYVEHIDREFDCWQDAWEAYARHYRRINHGCWKCGYQGQTDYVIDGKEYAVRHHACASVAYNEGVWDGDILPLLGCVWRHYGMSDGYPPPLVISAFPGYTPAMAEFEWEPDPDSHIGKKVVNWRVVYHPDFCLPREREPNPGEVKTDRVAYIYPDYNLLDWERDMEPYRSIAYAY